MKTDEKIDFNSTQLNSFSFHGIYSMFKNFVTKIEIKHIFGEKIRNSNRGL